MITKDMEVQTLAESLIYEIVKSLALPQTDTVKKIIRLIFGKTARLTAEIGLGLDRVIAEHGLAAGANWLLPRFVKSHRVRGAEIIPPSGPLVIASNHPAAVDSILISANVPRPDYKILAGNIPFFKNLPHASKHAIYTPYITDIAGRMQSVRESIRHLAEGGALLIFPRGSIEADPEFMPHPDDEFHHWSRSLEIFLQRVPQLQILITITSGVIARSAMRHPITWLRRARQDRQRLAFIYQMARQILTNRELFGLTPRVTFGELIEGNSREHFLAEIEQAARRTLNQHMAWANV